MFTGLVREKASVRGFERTGEGLWALEVESRLPGDLGGLGASICVNGTCLTLVSEIPAGGARLLRFELSAETLARTAFGALKAGDSVHLEPSLKAGDFLGGHWVSGHIDGVAQLDSIRSTSDGSALLLRLAGEARDRVAPYLVEKGSIAVEGVSLTVNSVRDEDGVTYLGLYLIPHTVQMTRFAELAPGAVLNLEADMMAKYAARYALYSREAGWTKS